MTLTADEKVFLFIFGLSAVTVFGTMLVSNIIEHYRRKLKAKADQKRVDAHKRALRHSVPNQFAELGNKYMLDYEANKIINELKEKRND